MSANNENNDGINSPMHMGLPGVGQNWAPEDIQELLGVMGGNHPHHHHDDDEGGDFLSSEAFANESNDAGDNSNLPPEETTISSSSQPATGAACLPDDDAKAQARSERKRSREKQRRSDVNKQFSDLIDVVQKIDAEDEEDGKPSVFGCSRVKFNPSNRVDLIARTIILLERLHDANKRRKTEMETLKRDLEEAKKAGEDTAAKLKEALLAPPGQPANKQFMMMVPMMMSSDGSGATSAVPMMNPYMPHAPMGAMPQPYCPMPAHAMAAPMPAAAPVHPAPAPTPASTAPSQAPAPAPPAAASQVAPGPAGTAQPGAPQNPQPAQVQPAQQQQQQHYLQPQQQHPHMPAGHQTPFSYMMPAPMAGGGYMMPFPTAGHHPMAAAPGQPMQMQMQMVPHHPHQAMHTLQPAPQQDPGRQEQKEASSPTMNGGSGNLAHCA